jgi:microcystin-dependent protein
MTQAASLSALGTNVNSSGVLQGAGGGVPTGMLQMWSTASAPTGYLLCDGSAVSRSTYSALFAVISTTFGTGDGSTTFNLPDYRGRSPLGVSGSYALASTGGSADAVVVSHSHTITDPSHNHGLNSNIMIGSQGSSGLNTGVGAGGAYTKVGQLGDTGNTGGTGYAGTGISINTTGSSGTGANLQPYLAINFIIKT